jgi:hypothetical protein
MAYEIPVDTVTDRDVTVQTPIDTFSFRAYCLSEEQDVLAIVVDLGNTVSGQFEYVLTKTLIVKGASVVSYMMLPTTGGAYILDTRKLMKKIVDDFLAGRIPSSDTKLINGSVTL